MRLQSPFGCSGRWCGASQKDYQISLRISGSGKRSRPSITPRSGNLASPDTSAPTPRRLQHTPLQPTLSKHTRIHNASSSNVASRFMCFSFPVCQVCLELTLARSIHCLLRSSFCLEFSKGPSLEVKMTTRTRRSTELFWQLQTNCAFGSHLRLPLAVAEKFEQRSEKIPAVSGKFKLSTLSFCVTDELVAKVRVCRQETHFFLALFHWFGCGGNFPINLRQF